jgi:hypothetical protein
LDEAWEQGIARLRMKVEDIRDLKVGNQKD